MIPKIIHYCWFGRNPLPELARKCIESWKKYCPDFRIIEWNEDNFDINMNDYVREAAAAKKWAFVSDVARLYALVKIGGFYMDTDVEVLRPLDIFCKYDALSGFESPPQIPTGLMACRAGHELFVELLAEYNNIHFIKTDGSFDEITNVERITSRCLEYGLILNNQKQTIRGFTLMPSDYFCPKNHLTGRISLTKNTYTIHHFNASWLGKEEKYKTDTRYKLCRYMPKIVARVIAKIVAIVRFRGVKELFSEMGKRIRDGFRES